MQDQSREKEKSARLDGQPLFFLHFQLLVIYIIFLFFPFFSLLFPPLFSLYLPFCPLFPISPFYAKCHIVLLSAMVPERSLYNWSKIRVAHHIAGWYYLIMCIICGSPYLNSLISLKTFYHSYNYRISEAVSCKCMKITSRRLQIYGSLHITL